MATLKASLKAAAECLGKGEYKEALQHCKAALKADKTSYDAFILIGKAAFHLNEHQQSELAYRKAIDVNATALPAWKGMAELYGATGNVQGAIEARRKLLELAPAEDPKRREWQAALADALSRAGQFGEAVQQYAALLGQPLPPQERLPLLCHLADIQMKLDEARAAAELQARMAALGSGEAAPVASHRTASSLQLEVMSHLVLLDQQAAPGAGPGPGLGSVGSPRRAAGASPRAPGSPGAGGGAGTAGSTWATLAEICGGTAPSPAYLRYHEELLKRCLLRIFAAPPRSVERQHHRLAALRECHAIIFNGHGGCCSALPYEAAVWLLEEEEEIKGGAVHVGGQAVGAESHIGCGQQVVLYAFENFARRMVHQFPTDPTAQVCLGLMLRRRACHDGTRPAPLTQRRQIEQLLRRAMAGDTHADCGSGWKALAELQYENMDYSTAYDTAVRGLAWLHSRRERGHEGLSQVALALRLIVAKALRRMGKLDDAEMHYKVLAGWVSEGESAFGELSGTAPMSINQQALRGIAQIALERGDRCAAKAQYERILGKAALGHGPGEHWAHSDYGWLLFQDGDLQGARQQLEQSLVVGEAPGSHATDVQLAEHRYRLGQVYWRMKGRYRSDKQFAYKQFLEAAKVESHAQAPALAALGRYFEVVEHKPEQAARCYKKAQALDPTLATAGEGLCRVFTQSGKLESVALLCREIASRVLQAIWAWKRLGFLHIQAKEFEQGIAAFQTALRGGVRDAAAWEGLASCYHQLGRFTAAFKAYTRALELDPQRLYSWVQSGSIRFTLGEYAEGLKDFARALELDPHHPAALLGAAETLAASARISICLGALGSAAKDLAAAAAHVLRCTEMHGQLVAAWKLLGDVLVLHHAADPAAGHVLLGQAEGGAAPNGTSAVADKTAGWGRRIRAVQLARRAYCKALRLDPGQGAAWQDVAASFYHEAQLRRAHPSFAHPPGCREELLAAAERAVRAGLRLDLASSGLWTALGTVAVEPSTREYALSRALQLDPKFTPAWLGLARLYTRSGAAGLADRCLQSARSQDPTVAGVWEAMGALAELSPAGEQDAAEFYAHSMGLGPGAEGMLGFVQAAIKEGRGAEGPVYAAARKVAELQPLNPAALNMLGLVDEARGDFGGAIKAFQGALQLLPFTGSDPGAALQQAASTTAGGGASVSLAAGVRLNLARALCKARRYQEAMGQYGEMEYTAELDGQPAGWLSYGLARLATGDKAGAELALQQGLEADKDSETSAEILRAMMQLQCLEGRPQRALELLQQQLPLLAQLHALLATVQRLWLTALAGAAVTGETGLCLQVCHAARSWAKAADGESAEFAAELESLLASCCQVAGQLSQALSRLSKAVHACPWEPHLRVAQAAAALQSSPRYAAAAERLLSMPALEAAARRKQTEAAPPLVMGKTALQLALETRSSALLSRCASAVCGAAREQLSALARALRADPTHTTNWYLAALVATQAAVGGCGAGSEYRRALGWCQAASSLVEVRAPEEVGMRTRLGICSSECLLHSGAKPAEALAAAEATLLLAAAGAPKAELAAEHCQVARCHWAAGDVAHAEAAFRQALGAAQHLPSVLGLAQLLTQAGRVAEVPSLLQQAQQELAGAAAGGLAGSSEARGEEERELGDVGGWVEVLLLRQAGTLSVLGDLEGAKAAALAAEGVERQRGAALQGQGHLAQLLRGAISLQQAQSMGAEEGGAAVLGEARQALLRAVQQQDSAVGRALLAQVESLSNLRKKEERVAAHAQQALDLAQRPIPAELLSLLGGLTHSHSLAAKAVHTEPWLEKAWTQLGGYSTQLGSYAAE